MEIVILILSIATVLNTIYIVALRSANDRLWSYLFDINEMVKDCINNESDVLKIINNIQKIIKE